MVAQPQGCQGQTDRNKSGTLVLDTCQPGAYPDTVTENTLHRKHFTLYRPNTTPKLIMKLTLKLRFYIKFYSLGPNS